MLNYNVTDGEELEFESEIGEETINDDHKKLKFSIELPAGENWFAIIYAKTVKLCNLFSFRSIMIAMSWSRNCSSMIRSLNVIKHQIDFIWKS